MADRPTVTLITGLPASGKTTAARALVEDGARRVNLDDLRRMLDFNDGSKRLGQEHEDAVLAIQDAAVFALIDAGFDVVVDNTHLTQRIPKRLRKLLGSRVTFDVLDLTDVGVETCLARDMRRESPVGPRVITTMASTLTKARKGGWRLTADWMNDTSSVYTYAPPKPYTRTDLPFIVICDIDGTVAINDGHRGHYDYSKVAADSQNAPVMQLVRLLAGPYPIMFLSGREDSCRGQTQQWLRQHFSKPFELHMRPTGDHRPDYLIKSELFDAHVRDKYSVHLVLDDRNQVVRLWRDMGLTCLQVADGDF